jgi:hypothetical protein
MGFPKLSRGGRIAEQMLGHACTLGVRRNNELAAINVRQRPICLRLERADAAR